MAPEAVGGYGTPGEPPGGVPPHNDEAEKAVLGAILLNTDPETVTEVFNTLREEDFYRIPNRIVYSAILRLSNRHDSIDFITLKDELRTLGELDKIDPAYLASLTTGVPSSANVDYYAKIVREASVRRKLLRTSALISSEAYDETRDLKTVLDDAEKNILAIADQQHTSGFIRAGDIVIKTLDAIEKFYHDHGQYTGIPSGYEDLDNLLSGFQKSEFIIIGARPSVGKTALALCMAANIAGISRKNSEKHAVGFFSLEMNKMSIMQRLISSEARISSHAIRTGMLQPADFNSMASAAERIYDTELYISDAPNMELLELRAEARRMHKQKKVEIIFIDYIGLIRLEDRRNNMQRWEMFTEISISLKALARELKIPIVVMSQLGRQVDKQASAPTMADLRESGSIEQDADVIILLDREQKRKKTETGEEKPDDSPLELRDLKVEKQRNGPTGALKLSFLKPYMRFESYTEKTYNR
jgi:replicative DNA helicase